MPAAVQYVRVTDVGLLAGRYRPVRSLGLGGFSEVWQAEDSVLGRAVAVKVFTGRSGQPDLVARFRREARTVAGLRHPNVVSVFDAGIDEGVPFVVMELLAGPSLDELVAARGPLSVDAALGYAGQAAAGLAAAHAAGVVHRDIKPANLVLDSDGTLKVVDFGIARLAEARGSLTATGVTFGTPAYLSPEQAAGHPAEPRSDLYALGCVLYALLAGAPPFTAEHPVAIAHQHLHAAAPPVHERRPGIPPAIDQLVASLLAKDPRDRPPDAATVQGWLERLSSGAGVATIAGTIPIVPRGPERPAPSWRRRWPLAAAGAAALGVVAVIVAVASSGGRHPATPAPVTPAVSSHSPVAQAATPTHGPQRRRHHHRRAPATPAGALGAVQRAIVRAENSGAIQPPAATGLLHQLTGISRAVSQGNLQDAAHKVGDLLHHLGDLTHNGQLTARGVAMIEPSVGRLARVLPPQS